MKSNRKLIVFLLAYVGTVASAVLIGMIEINSKAKKAQNRKNNSPEYYAIKHAKRVLLQKIENGDYDKYTDMSEKQTAIEIDFHFAKTAFLSDIS